MALLPAPVKPPRLRPEFERYYDLRDVLWDYGPLTVKDIAKRAGWNIAYARSSLSQMEDMGWLSSVVTPKASDLIYDIKYRTVTPRQLLAAPWTNWHPPTD